MEPERRKNWRKYIALTLALLSIVFMLLTVHRLAKLPNEPLWGSPALIWENWQFALIVGLGLPYPELMAFVVLLLILLVNYAIFNRLIKLFLP